MIPSKLEEAIQRTISTGKVPLAVNSTAGTTVLGAFDPFQSIADVCTKYRVWLHVDVCLFIIAFDNILSITVYYIYLEINK